MDASKRYSAGTAVPDSGMESELKFWILAGYRPSVLLPLFNLINLSTTTKSKDFYRCMT